METAALGSAVATPHLILAAATLLFVAATFFMGLLRRRGPPLPPGPRALPVIGHLHLLGPKPHQSFHALCQRYGPVISLRLGSTPAVVAATAEAATEFFKTHDLDFADRPQSTASRRFAYDSAGFAFAPYGPYWKFVRKVCMTDLLGGRTVEQLLPVRRRELGSLLGTLMEGARRGAAVDVSRELIRMTNNTIARMTTSRTCSPAEGEEGAGGAADPEEAMKLVKQVAELIGSFNAADHIWFLRGWDVQGLNRRIEDVHRRFDAMMERIIKQKEKVRRARKQGEDAGVKDLLDLLLDVSADEDADVRLTRENIKGIVLDVFTAGSDSSAVTVEWALAELINHPALLEKAKEEVDRVVGKERLVEEADVAGLPYLQAVVRETLRLHPAACFASREAIRDASVGDYRIPAGTALFHCYEDAHGRRVVRSALRVCATVCPSAPHSPTVAPLPLISRPWQGRLLYMRRIERSSMDNRRLFQSQDPRCNPSPKVRNLDGEPIGHLLCNQPTFLGYDGRTDDGD